ncbi:MAG: cyclic pyranopterin monophosphate synthase MoaC [Candidatus Hydrogenedentota bacterium]|nr:MAG: cyclic pyranopterin monophosphate synthase MoaC [Candidatus Hydrogenedentota bacterium]
MVNVAEKEPTRREAKAEGFVRLTSTTIEKIRSKNVKKGDVLAVARLAGIQGAKRTSELVPLCHPIPIEGVTVEVEMEEAGVRVTAEVVTTSRTGVEMEALTAVMTACLALYDMIKGVERGAVIERIQLLSKKGGRSGTFER